MREDLKEIKDRAVDLLAGKRCWHVSSGGAAGTTFQLALGKKIARKRPLRGVQHSAEYRHFEGEVILVAWCSWRLEADGRATTGSGDSSAAAARALKVLLGQSIVAAKIPVPSWELSVAFTSGLSLSLFPDHVGAEPIFPDNWELWGPQEVIVVAANGQVNMTQRSR